MIPSILYNNIENKIYTTHNNHQITKLVTYSAYHLNHFEIENKTVVLYKSKYLTGSKCMEQSYSSLIRPK